MDASPIPWFRELYDEILGYHRHALSFDVLNPWIEKARLAVEGLSCFRTHAALDPSDEPARFAIWNLYALSRVNDLLLMSFQVEATSHKSAALSWNEYLAFYEQIGFMVVSPATFAPFYHEIVRVVPSQDDNEPIELLSELWPAVMLGDLLISRAGVAVSGGRVDVNKNVAENSTLYFSYRRQSRKTNDLSRGWGGNSQWRTKFRRDYHANGRYFYNVDGANSLNSAVHPADDRDGLTRAQRVELCKHRCFIVTCEQDDDLWPYDDQYEEPA